METAQGTIKGTYSWRAEKLEIALRNETTTTTNQLRLTGSLWHSPWENAAEVKALRTVSSAFSVTSHQAQSATFIAGHVISPVLYMLAMHRHDLLWPVSLIPAMLRSQLHRVLKWDLRKQSLLGPPFFFTPSGCLVSGVETLCGSPLGGTHLESSALVDTQYLSPLGLTDSLLPSCTSALFKFL